MNRLFPVVPPQMSEREWQNTIQQALTRSGWSWMHQYRAKLGDGTWRTTASSRPTNGWPDLACFRAEWVLGIELKKGKAEKPTPQQIEWLMNFARIPTGLAWVVRPSDDWQQLANWIARPERAPKIFGFTPPE